MIAAILSRAHRLTGILAAVASAFLLTPNSALAYTFKPTPTEWRLWPEYCRARYVFTTVGSTSEFAAIYPKADVQRWRTTLGEPTWSPLHHYCAGVIWLHRYRMARTDQDRRNMLKNAEDECRYTFDRIPVTSPLYHQVASDLMMARAMRGAYPQTSH